MKKLHRNSFNSNKRKELEELYGKEIVLSDDLLFTFVSVTDDKEKLKMLIGEAEKELYG